MGDGPELGDDLVMGHADAVVAHRQRARCFVQDDLYLPVAGMVEDLLVRERFEARLVDGVGRVRNQLPQEDLLVRIEGVDHQVQQLFYFGLEFHFFNSHCSPRDVVFISTDYIYLNILFIVKRFDGRCRWRTAKRLQRPAKEVLRSAILYGTRQRSCIMA